MTHDTSQLASDEVAAVVANTRPAVDNRTGRGLAVAVAVAAVAADVELLRGTDALTVTLVAVLVAQAGAYVLGNTVRLREARRRRGRLMRLGVLDARTVKSTAVPMTVIRTRRRASLVGILAGALVPVALASRVVDSDAPANRLETVVLVTVLALFLAFLAGTFSRPLD